MNFTSTIKLLFISIIILIMAGCSSSDKSLEKKVSEFENAPTWIKNKKIDGYISEVGRADNSFKNFNEQRDNAIVDAKEKLSTKLNITINDIFETIVENDVNSTTKEEETQRITLATEQLVSNGIENSKVMKLWQSSSETIYVLVSTDTQKIKDDFREILTTTFKDIRSLESNYRLHLEKGDIDLTLNQ